MSADVPSIAPRCALTIDVEDWYQSLVNGDAPLTGRVVRNVDLVLAFLDDCGVRATFFVLGDVARRFPGVVRRIVEGGHEVQSHADQHRPLTCYTPRTLATSLERARKTTEDVAGTHVWAFRAPYFSVGPSNYWALDAIAQAGFEVDSSVFPARTPWYGVAGWPLAPHHLTTATGARLLEVPVAATRTAGVRVPIAGGGYLRLLPLPTLRREARRVLAECRPLVLYCHPYEFNPTETDEYRGLASWRSRLTSGAGRLAFRSRLRALLAELPFGTLTEAIRPWREPSVRAEAPIGDGPGFRAPLVERHAYSEAS